MSLIEEESKAEAGVSSDEGGHRVVGGSNVCDDVMNKGAGVTNGDDDDDDDVENQLINRRRHHFPDRADLTSSSAFTATDLLRGGLIPFSNVEDRNTSTFGGDPDMLTSRNLSPAFEEYRRRFTHLMYPVSSRNEEAFIHNSDEMIRSTNTHTNSPINLYTNQGESGGLIPFSNVEDRNTSTFGGDRDMLTLGNRRAFEEWRRDEIIRSINTHPNRPINFLVIQGESRETNVALNSGQHPQMAPAPADQRIHFSPKIVVTWIMGAVVGLPVAHDLLIRYLGDRSEGFKSNHKIVEGLSVMSLWAVIVFGVLLSLVFALPTLRPRAMCMWFPSACFGCLMCFAVLIMIVEFFLVLTIQ